MQAVLRRKMVVALLAGLVTVGAIWGWRNTAAGGGITLLTDAEMASLVGDSGSVYPCVHNGNCNYRLATSNGKCVYCDGSVTRVMCCNLSAQPAGCLWTQTRACETLTRMVYPSYTGILDSCGGCQPGVEGAYEDGRCDHLFLAVGSTCP